ncbi:cytochrome P450 [Kitasatospora sp. NPDC093550]|uniref:cytochrome P450 n=1 Tax=Kitasatospora sp. NPDC093550 TaxID=3364089 RepID=UPI0038226EAD
MTLHLDPADPAFARDPHAFYAAVRELGPATRVTLANGTDAWLVTGYHQARAVLTDPRLSNVPAPQTARHTSAAPSTESPPQARSAQRSVLERHMLNADADEHRRLRRLAAPAFTPRRVDAVAARIGHLADTVIGGLTAKLRQKADADLVDDFAFPLPVLVISDILGVPEADRLDLRAWTYRVGSPAATLPSGQAARAWQSLHGYFTHLIARKRRHPGDDLLSLLTHDRTPQAPDDGELLAMAFLLLFAGYETTMNLLASATLLLLTHSEELLAARTAGDPGWSAVIEETLRHASPLEGATWRRTTEPVDLGGTVIPAGASVLAVLAAANRDPRVFAAPHTFRPRRYAPGNRTAPAHLAFGHGPHVCLGARLARLEAGIALPRLFAALPSLRLATAPAVLPWRPGLLVRGPLTLPVRLA